MFVLSDFIVNGQIKIETIHYDGEHFRVFCITLPKYILWQIQHLIRAIGCLLGSATSGRGTGTFERTFVSSLSKFLDSYGLEGQSF